MAGGGVLIARKWEENVVEVKRLNERIILVRVAIGKGLMNILSVYAPQVGRARQEKEEFYEMLGGVVGSVREGERLFVCGDLNGHVGEKTEGYEEVHGGKGFGMRNTEGELLLEFADARDLTVMNTWFEKKENQKVTYESGGNRSVVGYVLTRRLDRAMVADAKVIASEPCILQHKLLFCGVKWKERDTKVKRVFVDKCKLWNLKETASLTAYQKKVEEREARRVEVSVEGLWKGLKDCLIEEANEVCGRTKGLPRHKESWWWNDEVEDVVAEKRRKFLLWRNSNNKPEEAEMKEAYQEANRRSKVVIYKAKDAHRQEFLEELEKEVRRVMCFDWVGVWLETTWT